jgi:hypothetical protein
MDRLYAAYHDRVEFFIVYIQEAHPSDGGALPANTRAGISIKEPSVPAERRQVADKACKELKLRWPCLVDDMSNSVNRAYAAWPTRLYIVDTEGRIAVAGGPGPRGLAPSMSEAEDWLRAFTGRSKGKETVSDQRITP